MAATHHVGTESGDGCGALHRVSLSEQTWGAPGFRPALSSSPAPTTGRNTVPADGSAHVSKASECSVADTLS